MKISVITVCRNNATTIGRALASVARQVGVDVEQLIVDGASTDRTLVEVEKYRSATTKIVSEPDDGIYDARNKGVRISSGSLIGFLHADDQYVEEDVLLHVAREAVAGANVVYGGVQFSKGGNGEWVLRRWVPSKEWALIY